jgi:hypothetical protein
VHLPLVVWPLTRLNSFDGADFPMASTFAFNDTHFKFCVFPLTTTVGDVSYRVHALPLYVPSASGFATDYLNINSQ